MNGRLVVAAMLLAGAVAPAELPVVTEVVNGRTAVVSYRGVRAVKLIPAAAEGKDEDMLFYLRLTNGRSDDPARL